MRSVVSLVKRGENMNTQLHYGFFGGAVGLIVLNRIENGGQLFTKEHQDHSGRRLVRSEPVIVPGGCNRETEQILIIVNRLDDRTEEEQELRVLIGRFAGGQQIDAGVGCHEPVCCACRFR